MNSEELSAYISATDGISKPWLLAQLRLKKLQEQQHLISPEEYARSLADIHRDIINLGEWWLGIEDQVF
ncbi:MAG: hypothetical protein HC895_14255 [Leptolyngbyaceae cyanobacterium SM1_3_5]|nr:hypothetical protein [Leptolyngbyaceae cyanobacterium SM1_3_5]